MRKLYGRQGSSAVFALVIFLVLSILAAVMVSGALSAVRNTGSQQEEEQARLSLTSAVEVLRRAVEDPLTDTPPEGDLAGNEKRVLLISYSYNDEDLPAALRREAPAAPVYTRGQAVMHLLAELVQDPSASKTLTLSDPTGDEGLLNSVQAVLTMDAASHDLTVVLSVPGSSAGAKAVFRCLSGVEEHARSIAYTPEGETEETYAIETERVQTFRWVLESVERGGAA